MNNLIKINNFPNILQTTDFSCGAAVTLMILKYFGYNQQTQQSLIKKLDIRSINNKRSDNTYGCKTIDIVKYLTKNNIAVKYNTNNKNLLFKNVIQFREFVINNIKIGNPILVESLFDGGHWNIIYGYDNNRNRLLISDPIYSYVTASIYDFFNVWYDKNLISTNIVYQQFILVEKQKSINTYKNISISKKLIEISEYILQK